MYYAVYEHTELLKLIYTPPPRKKNIPSTAQVQMSHDRNPKQLIWKELQCAVG